MLLTQDKSKEDLYVDGLVDAINVIANQLRETAKELGATQVDFVETEIENTLRIVPVIAGWKR